LEDKILGAIKPLPWRQASPESVRYGIPEQVRDPYQIRHSLAIYEAWNHKDVDSVPLGSVSLRTAASEYFLEGQAKALQEFCRKHRLQVYVPGQKNFQKKKRR
jgi:hypothetical protein